MRVTRREFVQQVGAAIALSTGVSWAADELVADVTWLTPDDAGYAAARQPFNDRLKMRPKIIALCHSEKGVQMAVQRAREEKLPIAIKSGGHSFEGFSLNEGGMVISLATMKTLRLDKEALVASSGVKLGQLNDYLLPKGRILPAGSCSGVGLGGLTLGGGYGLFAREYGLTCDHLIGVRLVDGMGEVHDSDANKELLRVCRGGGNGNFGVITEMRFRTHKAPPMMTSKVYQFKSLTKEKAVDLAREWFSATALLPNDAFSAYVLNGKFLTVLLTFLHAGSGEQSFGAFDGLSKQATKQFKSRRQPLATAIKRYYGRQEPLPFKNASAGYYKTFADICNVYPQVVEKVMASPGMIMQFNTLGGAIDREEYVKNSLYPHRGYGYLGELQSYWTSKKSAQRCLKAFKEVQQIYADGGIDRHYRNYPDVNIEKPMEAYYTEQGKADILKMKSQLDPEGVFQYAQLEKLEE